MLDVLADMAAQTAPPTSGPWKFVPIPAAVVALMTLLSYALGFIRPVAIRRARYWTTGADAHRMTELSCQLQNRKVNVDRTLTSLALIRVPSLGYRLLHWRWRRDWVDEQAYILSGDVVTDIRKRSVKISKRDQYGVRCRIIHPTGRSLKPDERLPREVRLVAYFGASRPAMKRPKYVPV